MAGSKYSNREDTLASLTCYGDEQRVQSQESGKHQQSVRLPLTTYVMMCVTSEMDDMDVRA